MDAPIEKVKRRRFVWGVCLAWIPFLFLAIPSTVGIIHTFRAGQKATGEAFIASGLAEIFSIFGLAVTVVFEVTAIILLLRAFSGDRPRRAAFSALSIGCAGFVLAVAGLFVWWVFNQRM